MPLIKNTCDKCEAEIGAMQYSNYYVCEACGSTICLNCYNKGQKVCHKCEGTLEYKDGDKTAKFANDNNLLF